VFARATPRGADDELLARRLLEEILPEVRARTA
jgi:hypothetical protein